MALKDNDKVVRNLGLLHSHVQQLIDTAFGPLRQAGGIQIQSELNLGPSVYVANISASFSEVSKQLRNLLVWIAISTPVLLVAILVGVLVLLLR